MRRECRERLPHHRFQRKPLVSDPVMHHGTCVTHVPWCMSGSLTRGDGENVSGIPGACAPAILRIWQEAHAIDLLQKSHSVISHNAQFRNTRVHISVTKWCIMGQLPYALWDLWDESMRMLRRNNMIMRCFNHSPQKSCAYLAPGHLQLSWLRGLVGIDPLYR